MVDYLFETKAIAPGELPALIAAIEQAMQQAERSTQKAAQEHLRAFAMQMREILGTDEIALDEPYLPETEAISTLRYLRQLEKLIDTLQRSAEDETFRTTVFNANAPLMPQLQTRLELEQVRHKLTVKQTLDSQRQPAYGIKQYRWITAGDDSVRASHRLRNGKIYSWDNDDIHPGQEPGCRCIAEPVVEGAGTPDNPYPDAINSVYPVETLVAGLAGLARSIALGVLRRAGIRTFEDEETVVTEEPTDNQKTPDLEESETGKEPPPGGREDTNWEFGKHKSKTKWENRMRKRKWTEEQITDTIKHGKEYNAPNDVRKHIDPDATATRYEKNGRFIVRDDKTREILQISDDNFIPKELP